MTEKPCHPDILAEIMVELATELDLHYEDVDMPSLRPSIERLRKGADVLKMSDYQLPEEVAHILERFRRAAH